MDVNVTLIKKETHIYRWGIFWWGFFLQHLQQFSASLDLARHFVLNLQSRDRQLIPYTPNNRFKRRHKKKHQKARKTHQHVRNCIGKERTRNQKETSGNVRNCRGQATVKGLNEKCQALEAAKPKVPCVTWKGDVWSPRMSEEYGKWESLGFLGSFYGNYCLSMKMMGNHEYVDHYWRVPRDSLKRFLEPLLGQILNECLWLQTIFGVYPKHEMNSSTKQVGFPTN